MKLESSESLGGTCPFSSSLVLTPHGDMIIQKPNEDSKLYPC